MTVKRFLAAAGATLLAAAAFSFVYVDATIRFIRSSESPSLGVQYSGAKAAKISLRINGVNVGSKNLNADRSKGLVAFKIERGTLGQGDNIIEAFLYDAKGKLLGTEKTTVYAQTKDKQPVYVRMPKGGAAVQGTVEISVGLGIEMREAYVSFFVDKQFKSLKNYPPFSYHWDTTQESNGWHEIEAWTFDRSQTTRKSQPVRVLVNNPGGRTERQDPEVAPKPEPATKPAPKPEPVSAAAKPAPKPATKPAAKPGPKTEPVAPAPKPATKPVTKPAPNPAPVVAPAPKPAPKLATKPATKPAPKPVVTPKPASEPILPDVSPMAKPTNPPVYAEAAPKPVTKPAPAITIKPAAPGAKPEVIKPAPKPEVTTSAPAPKSITMKIAPGTRLENGAVTISVDGKSVEFDVVPRVDGGVPLSPFRHLFESAGGEVNWQKFEKICTAKGLGKEVWIKIGGLYAKVNGKEFKLEVVPFLEKGRTIVPLSFISEALNFNVDFDPATRHVLITKK
ncbi:MAG: hypothetical protein H0W86_10835 [Armatimonadetes bacterium]|nr:hypothetical protein [Armatimonadota bacterium]